MRWFKNDRWSLILYKKPSFIFTFLSHTNWIWILYDSARVTWMSHNDVHLLLSFVVKQLIHEVSAVTGQHVELLLDKCAHCVTLNYHLRSEWWSLAAKSYDRQHVGCWPIRAWRLMSYILVSGKLAGTDFTVLPLIESEAGTIQSLWLVMMGSDCSDQLLFKWDKTEKPSNKWVNKLTNEWSIKTDMSWIRGKIEM